MAETRTLAGCKIVADDAVPPGEAWLTGPPTRRSFVFQGALRVVEDRPILGRIVNLAPLPSPAPVDPQP